MSSIPTVPKINWISFMGDSLTNTDSQFYIPKSQQIPKLVQSMIGGNCRERNLGVGGQTTLQMLARMYDMLRYPPTVGVIYGGINDANPSNAIQAGSYTADPVLPPTLSTTVNTGSTLPVGITYYVTFTWVSGSESNSSPEASIYVPLGNQLVVTLPTFPSGVTSANIYISTTSGNETKQGSTSSNTYTQSVALVAGVVQPKATLLNCVLNMVNQLKNAGCNKIVICNIHTMGGTTSIGTTDSTYTPYRNILQSIATNNNLAFCDYHAVSLISPTDYNTSNDLLHLAPSGLQKLANQLKATLDAQGWTSILQN
jgi:lysophospholipase L1-like esterase